MRHSFAVGSVLWLGVLLQSVGGGDVTWPVNGGIDNIRYSPLAQINRTNVHRLQLAWTYDSHDAFRASEMQSNPIVVDGVLYAVGGCSEDPQLDLPTVEAYRAA